MFGVVSAYLLAFTAWRYFGQGVLAGAQYNLLVAFLSFFVIGYRKQIYATSSGMVKETSTWLSCHRELLGWNEVSFVTIMTSGNNVIIFFERDTIGWKVMFGKNQMPELREIFRKYIPDVEIGEIGR